MHLTDELGLYVHIPFCANKCPYCDFNTYAGLEGLIDAYVGALCLELAEVGRRVAGRGVTSVFIGGGTPTLLSPSQFGRVMKAIRAHFALVPSAEITSEANPGTVDLASFDALVEMGVNRLSLGAQSFVAEELEFLGRQHSAADLGRAYDAARRAGFSNVSLDLIFGLPDQCAADLARSLEALVALAPDHVSAYSLIVEPDTPLGHAVKAGKQKPPDDDVVAELYDQVADALGAAGYVHYEVSNWAKKASAPARDAVRTVQVAERSPEGDLNPPFAAQHNLVYWRNGEFVGVGPGAHSHLRLLNVAQSFIPTSTKPASFASLPPHLPATVSPLDRALAPARDRLVADPSAVEQPTRRSHRWANLKPVPAYIKHMNAGEAVEAFSETVSVPSAMAETMMLGLRLVREGVPRARFRALHGAELGEVYRSEVAEMVSEGLLVEDAKRVRVTDRGLRFHSHVAMAFLPDEPN